MKIFNTEYLNNLSVQAKLNPRLRQHNNIHQSYEDNCQCLFNAIELGSYIRPHRHASDPKNELLIAIRGLLGVVIFDELGNISEIFYLSSVNQTGKVVSAIELPSNVWHTVLALEPNSVLLEIKAGPFDPLQPKDLAMWAPEENSELKDSYFIRLYETVVSELGK